MTNGESSRKGGNWTKTDRRTALLSVFLVMALLTLPFAAVSLDKTAKSQIPFDTSGESEFTGAEEENTQFSTESDEEEYITRGGVTGPDYIYGPDSYGPLGKYRLAYKITGTSTRTVELVGWDTSMGYYQASGLLDIPASMTSSGISYSVTSIISSAFNGCGYITTVTVPDGVVLIGANAFINCVNTVSITVGSNNAIYSSEDGVLFNKAKTTLITYPAGKPGDYVVPSSVSRVESYAFYGAAKMTSATMSNVITLGNNVFNNCLALAYVNIPNSVTTIGGAPFYNCLSLSSIDVGAGNLNFLSEDGVLFNNMKTSIICYPAGKGGDYVVPSTVSTLEVDSFRFSQITSIDMNNVTNIKDSAIQNCTSLASVNLRNVVTIGANAFNTCTGLASITIPGTVTTIGATAFYNCTTLQSINVDSSNTKYASESGVLFNKTKTNLMCYPAGKSGNYVVPSSVSTIDANSFYGSKIVSLDTNNVTTIGNSAVRNCANLTSLKLTKVTYIGSSAFQGPSLLTTVEMGVVKTIANDAFNNSINLISITVPASTTSIGSNAFVNCINLQSITVAPDNLNYSSEDGVLFNKTKTTLIAYPAGKVGDYAVPSSVSRVENYAFHNAQKITSADLNNATYIGTMHSATTSVFYH